MTRRSFLKNLTSLAAVMIMPVAFIDDQGNERLLLVDDDGTYGTLPSVEEEVTEIMARQFAEDLDKEFIRWLQ